jgi:hypothetical protein
MKPPMYGLFVAASAVAACGPSGSGAAHSASAGGPDSGTAVADSGPGVRDAGAGDSSAGNPGHDASTTHDSGAPPAPAAAVGYDVQTLGPAVRLGSNWHPFSFFGTDPASVVTAENADGSVSIVGGGNDYGAQLSTASATGAAPYFTGTAFGGGGYFEITMATGGPASFWANDIETMAGITAGDLTVSQWSGQAAGFGDWIECDFSEFDTTGVYGFAMHNWYGVVGSGVGTSTLNSGSPASPPGAVYTQKYDPSGPPPPSETDGTAYSVLDTRHLALILGGPGLNDAGVMSTVYAVSVWQASAADNLVR